MKCFKITLQSFLTIINAQWCVWIHCCIQHNVRTTRLRGCSEQTSRQQDWTLSWITDVNTKEPSYWNALGLNTESPAASWPAACGCRWPRTSPHREGVNQRHLSALGTKQDLLFPLAAGRDSSVGQTLSERRKNIQWVLSIHTVSLFMEIKLTHWFLK